MSDMACPWCEARLEGSSDGSDEQQCPECLTTWCYEDADVDLLIAA